MALNYPSIVSKNDQIRKEIYNYSVQLIKAYPLQGIGLADFQTKIDALSTNNLFFRWFGLPYALHPHNLFLALWLNLGLLGLLVFIIIVMSYYETLIFSNSTRRLFLIAAMTAILVHGFFDTTYFKNDLAAIFWLLIAVSIVISNKDAKKI
jgi:O-antigen ligase